MSDRDAERYRWLREQLKTEEGLVRVQALFWISGPSRTKLDKAIDLALKEDYDREQSP